MKLLFPVAVIVAATATAPVDAATDECRDARAAYKAALEALSRSLQDYTLCLKSSHGDDDCAVAFVDVEAAQKAIEDAVSQIGGGCR